MIIDLFQDKRVYINQKKKSQGKNVLPQIKYTPSLLKKMHDDIILTREPHPRGTQIYHQPLSNILISKRICPSFNPQDISPQFLRKRAQPHLQPQLVSQLHGHNKKQAFHKFEKTQEDSLNHRNSTSLSHRSHRMQGKTPQKYQLSMQQSQKKVKIRNDELTYVLGKGNNNQQLIKQILDSRKIWRQIKWGQCIPHFKWVFSKQRHNYKKMWSFNQKRIINHFEFNQQLTTKDMLIRNLQIYCQTKKMEIFTITPITFIIDFDDQYCQYNLKQFLSFFSKNDPRKNILKKTNNNNISYNLVNKFMGYMAWQNSDIKKKVNILSRPINNSTYYSQSSYIWLLKPTGLNRGRGIQIFDSLQQLQKILLDFMVLMNRKKINQKTKTKQAIIDLQVSVGQSKFSCQKFKLNSCSFIIQKYVQKPLLIQGRKFDIRVWVLLSQNLKMYFFKQGYIRTSGEMFSTEDIDNYYIHLTNNAIQKNAQNYGQFENGNQLSYKDLSKYIGQDKTKEIWERIKQISYMAFSSVKKKINVNQRKFCFEIFGLDYIIDAENKVWLIEINENPCIQCASPLLQKLIPRMINDAFKLTIDTVFTDKRPQQKNYPVQGYLDNQNMWESIGLLAPNLDYSPKKL